MHFKWNWMKTCWNISIAFILAAFNSNSISTKTNILFWIQNLFHSQKSTLNISRIEIEILFNTGKFSTAILIWTNWYTYLYVLYLLIYLILMILLCHWKLRYMPDIVLYIVQLIRIHIFATMLSNTKRNTNPFAKLNLLIWCSHLI